MTVKADKHRCKHYPYANKKSTRTFHNRCFRRRLDEVEAGAVWVKPYKKRILWDIW